MLRFVRPISSVFVLASLAALGACVELPPGGGGSGGGHGENTRVLPGECAALGGEALYDPGDGSVLEAGCPDDRALLAMLVGIEGGLCCASAGLGEDCGPKTCAAGEVCCNESCGICTPPGGGCIELYCEPAAAGCDSITCDAGTHCEMQDVVCVTDPCPPQPTCVPDPTCDLVDCMDDSECELVEVQCFAEPCFPIPQCVPVGH